MKEWLDNNNFVMYLTYNKGKPVLAETFIKTLKYKIYQRVTANGRKVYLSYLNKIVNQQNNTYHRSIDKIPINADYIAWID